ncbi:MAG TPA: hypothetical protein PK333_04180 [Candidatus Moranbacteria bacterium]|nr:hypothetical protein [Candidatus Moranbacteria bacterium]
MTLNEDQIKKGFWYYRPDIDFPPRAIKSPEQYSGQERIDLRCTQLDLDSKKQKNLTASWCAYLPTLEKIKYLWFDSKVNQMLFDAACQMENLEGLHIKWSSIKSLDNLLNLKNLKYLHIGSSTKIENINCIGNLNKLIVLEIAHFKKISQIDPIGNLVQLEGLAIEGNIDTTYIIETLKPLENLALLRHLSLGNLKTRDKTLSYLNGIKSLEYINLAHWWDEAEIEALKKNLPNLKYGSINC